MNEPAPWPDHLAVNRAQALELAARRYHGAGPEPFYFAWFKLRLDPMFRRLTTLVGCACHVLDLGAGYGVPAVWLLAQQPGLYITAIESDFARARVARWAIGERGAVFHSPLPELPDSARGAERALLIDVAHYLNDVTLAETLHAAKGCLPPGGTLILRDTVPSASSFAWERELEQWRLRRRGISARFRSSQQLKEVLTAAGYEVRKEHTAGREETWFIAQR